MDPLALLILGTSIWGAIEILRYAWIDIRHADFKRSLAQFVAKENGLSLFSHARLYGSGIPFYLVAPTLFFIVILLAGATGDAARAFFWSGAAIVVGNLLKPQNDYITRHLRMYQANQPQAQEATTEQHADDFGVLDDDDDFFARSGPDTRSNPRRKAEPHRIGHRHDDDKGLWAKFDDPTATQKEKDEARRKIHRREMMRNKASSAKAG